MYIIPGNNRVIFCRRRYCFFRLLEITSRGQKNDRFQKNELRQKSHLRHERWVIEGPHLGERNAPRNKIFRLLSGARNRELWNFWEKFIKVAPFIHLAQCILKKISDIRHNHKTNWAQILITDTLACTVKIPALRFRRSRNFVTREWPDFRNFLMKENSLIKSCLERKKLKFL